MARYETKKIVFSKSDLPADVKVGEVRKYFSSHIKIKDLDYTNQYGTFVLCDYIFDAEERELIDWDWDIQQGVQPDEGNPFEVLHIIRSPYHTGFGGSIGYIIKDNETGYVKGISYRQLWELLFYRGAVNAVATESQFVKNRNMKTYLIDSIEELPAFDSSYWISSLYDSEGDLLVPISKEVEKEMEKSLRMEISRRISAQIRRLKQNLHKAGEVEQDLEPVVKLIGQSKKISVLTGAGISTMSGIPDYRSAVEGVWRKKPDLLETLNQHTFLMNPKEFWNSYYQLFAVTLSDIIPVPTNEAVLAATDVIKPNEGHRFFAGLEEEGRQVAVMTQNVDGLHQQAGSKQVLEIHGNVNTCSCPRCGEVYQLTTVYKEGNVPTCECGSVLRPDVVFFGDPVKEYKRAEELIADSDLIIVAGTSLQVAPFNQLVNLVSARDIPKILINGEIPDNSVGFDHILQGNISEICKQLHVRLCSNKG